MKEISGVAFAKRSDTNAYTCSITVKEWTGCVLVNIGHEASLTPEEASLTPEEARHLARCLLRAAKRVEGDIREKASS